MNYLLCSCGDKISEVAPTNALHQYKLVRTNTITLMHEICPGEILSQVGFYPRGILSSGIFVLGGFCPDTFGLLSAGCLALPISQQQQPLTAWQQTNKLLIWILR